MPVRSTHSPCCQGTAILMHRSTRLRDATSTVLEQAGFVVLVAGDVPAICEAVRSGCMTPVVALVEHEMGGAMTPWRCLWGELPRAIPVFGLVEAVGPANTPEATLVTRGEREVHGPMPVAELPVVLGWVVAADKANASPIRNGGGYP